MNHIQANATITAGAYRQLIAVCQAGLPHEACGVLACSMDEDIATVSACPVDSLLPVNRIHTIRNVAAAAAHSFQFHPQDWIDTLYLMQKNRQSLVGLFHSHPGSLPIPSAADHAGISFSATMSYWIISLINPQSPIVQPYRYCSSDQSFRPLMLAQIGI
ncbi:M67 family metallopeptidase [Paenibacillus oenotherae]|uniref:M67 family metallopeptidase n=1 Tax=Paenibacillus oenotherae TaxID=1435645 RepID=A0ABS7DCQ5_9BACL|nr:M67 family metallopeptidase [Paenibacillus oenotherae]MBW7477722.1 M67 family metallopeptidase [Paenibacillus oenotherae]